MKQLGGQEVRELENRKKSFNSRVFDTLQNNINRILKKFFFLFDVFFFFKVRVIVVSFNIFEVIIIIST